MKEESNYPGNEMWKTHPQIPTVEVSTLGRVKVKGKLKTPRKCSGHNNYYWKVACGSRELGSRRRHRLVGETWLNAGPDDCVLHRDEELPPDLIDGVANLWIGDRVDNYKDRDAKGRLKGKQKNIIPQYMRRRVVGMWRLGVGREEIADITGINPFTVRTIINRDKGLTHE